MKRILISFLVLMTPILLVAQNEKPVTTEDALTALRAAAVDQEADFDTAYSQAESSGVEEEVLLESKVLRLLGGGQDACAGIESGRHGFFQHDVNA